MSNGFCSKLDKAFRKMSGSQPHEFQNNHCCQYETTVTNMPYNMPYEQSSKLPDGPPGNYQHEPNDDPLFYAQNKYGSDLKISRRELFELIQGKKASREALTNHVLSTLKLNTAPPHVQKHVKQEVSRFYSRCISRWKQSRHVKDRFLRFNSGWISIEMKANELVAGADHRLAMRLQGNRIDTPPPQEPVIKVEAEPFPRRERMDHTGRSLRALPEIPPEEPPKPRPKMSKRNAPVSYTPEETLDNLIVKAKLTKRQYEIIRNYALGINCFIYPSFAAIEKVMRDRAAMGIPFPQIKMEGDNEGEGEDNDRLHGHLIC